MKLYIGLLISFSAIVLLFVGFFKVLARATNVLSQLIIGGGLLFIIGSFYMMFLHE